MSAATDASADDSSWEIQRAGAVVRARFVGYLDARSGAESAREFDEETRGLERIALVFDVRHMKGYDNNARRAWGQMMRLRRRQIASLETIGAVPIVRLGASLLGMLAGVQVKHRGE